MDKSKSTNETFDPYEQWLGIAPHEHPVHFYRLIGVAVFETDPQRILQAVEERMSHVRSFQTGRRAQFTQKILNELSSAKICLTNPASKASYDAVLRGQLSVSLDDTQAVLPPIAAPATAPMNFAPSPLSGVPLPGPPVFGTPAMFGGVPQPGFGHSGTGMANLGYAVPPAVAMPQVPSGYQSQMAGPAYAAMSPAPPPIAPPPEPVAPPPVLPSINLNVSPPATGNKKTKQHPVPPQQVASPRAVRQAPTERVSIFARPWFPFAAIGVVAALVVGGMVIWKLAQPRPAVPHETQPMSPTAISEKMVTTTDVAEKPQDGGKAVVLTQEGDGGFNFPASLATIRGTTAQRRLQNDEYVIGNWTNAEDSLSWRFRISRPGFFRVRLVYSTNADAAGGRYGVSLGMLEQTGDLRSTGGPESFLTETVVIAVTRSGEHTLTLRCLEKPGAEFMTFKSLHFIPHNAPTDAAEMNASN